MKNICIFVRSTIKALFASVIGWTLNIITFAALWISVTFQAFPIWTWIIVLIINIFIAMFLAWKEEKIRADKFQSELLVIKENIPVYTVQISDIKRYSIESLIDASSHKLTSIKQALENTKKSTETTSLSSHRANNAVGGLLAKIEHMQKNLPSLVSSLGYESEGDKLKRLRRYHKELQQHENTLKPLYQVSLSLESTRYDKNVEIEIASTDTYSMIVEDDYETEGIPTTSAPDPSHTYLALPNYGQHIGSLSGKYYLQSYAENNKAFSELAYINASHPTDIFNSTYYIKSDQDKVNLVVKIHSTKLTGAQTLIVPLDLVGVPVIKIQSDD